MSQMIHLKAVNGSYVCAEGGGGSVLIANRGGASYWETFELVDLGAGKVALRADNGMYVCAEGGGGQQLVVNRGQIGAWETFELVDLGGSFAALKAANGQYVCAENAGSMPLVANRGAVGPWERFFVEKLPPVNLVLGRLSDSEAVLSAAGTFGPATPSQRGARVYLVAPFSQIAAGTATLSDNTLATPRPSTLSSADVDAGTFKIHSQGVNVLRLVFNVNHLQGDALSGRTRLTLPAGSTLAPAASRGDIWYGSSDSAGLLTRTGTWEMASPTVKLTLERLSDTEAILTASGTFGASTPPLRGARVYLVAPFSQIADGPATLADNTLATPRASVLTGADTSAATYRVNGQTVKALRLVFNLNHVQGDTISGKVRLTLPPGNVLSASGSQGEIWYGSDNNAGLLTRTGTWEMVNPTVKLSIERLSDTEAMLTASGMFASSTPSQRGGRVYLVAPFSQIADGTATLSDNTLATPRTSVLTATDTFAGTFRANGQGVQVLRLVFNLNHVQGDTISGRVRVALPPGNLLSPTGSRGDVWYGSADNADLLTRTGSWEMVNPTRIL